MLQKSLRRSATLSSSVLEVNIPFPFHIFMFYTQMTARCSCARWCVFIKFLSFDSFHFDIKLAKKIWWKVVKTHHCAVVKVFEKQFIHLVSFQSIRLLTTNTLEKKRLKSIIFLTTYYLCTSSILGIKCHSNTWMHLFVFSLMIFLRGFKNENLHFDWWAKKHWS